MTTTRELMRSLELLPRHGCCDDAEMWLDPPARGCDRTALNVGFITVKPQPKWVVVDACEIIYCPFCGERLPSASDEG